MPKVEIREYKTEEESLKSNGDYILKTALKEVQKKGFFTFVLSGGNTPKSLFEYLASPSYSKLMPWRNTYIFWVDDRCVEPDHPDSNFRMADEAMLSKIIIPSENIFRMPTEIKPSEEAAKIYEKKIIEFFKNRGGSSAYQNKIPVFDLILLGIGEDGHTASLFPNAESLNIIDRMVISAAPGGTSPKIPRLTLTKPIINNADSILFLISGERKQNLARHIFNNRKKLSNTYPAAQIEPRNVSIWSLF